MVFLIIYVLGTAPAGLIVKWMLNYIGEPYMKKYGPGWNGFSASIDNTLIFVGMFMWPIAVPLWAALTPKERHRAERFCA